MIRQTSVFSLVDLLRLFGRPQSSGERDRDKRSTELVDYLKARAEAKRQRRRERNLRERREG